MEELLSIRSTRDINLKELLGREIFYFNIEDVDSYLEGQVIMITGGGGSIGSELCRQIASFSPKTLIILDNYENNAYNTQIEILRKWPNLDLVTVIANIREKRRIDEIFKKYKPDIVFHTAAHKHVPLMEENPSEAIKNNIFGTQNVAECANKYYTKKFIMISTDKAVNPSNIMGVTKRISEGIIQSYNSISSITKFAAVRFGNILGSSGSVIPLFIKQIEEGGPITVTHPDVTRFFMTIYEAVQLVIQVGVMAKGGEIFVLDMGQPIKIYDLARNLIALFGLIPDKDIEIIFTGLRPGEKLHEEILWDQERLQPAKNKKIFVIPPIHVDFQELYKSIRNLKKIVYKTGNDNNSVVINYLQNMIPKYNL
jgi:FlaA1/EpsC-like NDP-sugar epimerase